MSCPNDKAATPPQSSSSSGGGVNNADGDSNSAADNLMSELPNETLDSILADAVKVGTVSVGLVLVAEVNFVSFQVAILTCCF